ncbi:PREDICTED: replication protein A 70 kDa DNA-binding subunit C-like isoform X2 [Camelina sativa]|uniref:Replication protein A subunit n=1 Tax=Camelina sativa TaxID=90675 RepID=A0ABM0Y2Y3_CAMSA|nr:PREDICTED: replication protein A 70 kDa DNA-binding subunit C-like isoform X2 [Camelina sativa]
MFHKQSHLYKSNDMAATFAFLKDVRPFKTAWKVQVKVIHSWRQNTENTVETLELVLSDSMSKQIHAPVLNLSKVIDESNQTDSHSEFGTSSCSSGINAEIEFNLGRGRAKNTMAVNLTAEAIAKMLNGEVASENDMTPVLQVTELKMIQSKLNQNHESSNRYKITLSDGILSQQGMLNASLNSLVVQGSIQLGSILKLTRFVCNRVQTRRIVVVADVEILVEKCDIIGTCVQSGSPNEPGRSSVFDQQRSGMGSVITQQSNGCGFEQQQAKRTDLNGGRYGASAYSPQPQVVHNSPDAVRYSVSANLPQPQVVHNSSEVGRYGLPANSPQPQVAHNSSDAGRYGGANLAQPQVGYNSSDAGRYGVPASSPQRQVGQRYGTGSGYSETSPSTRPYGSSNAGYGGSRLEQPRAPPATTAYSRPVQSSYQPQPPPMYVNRGPVARNEAPPRITPISALNPYQGRWTIKVRVTCKGVLRRFSNTRGEGKLFSFDLLDSGGGEIRVTCFNDVVDQFFDQIVVGNVYLISRGSLKPAQKNFNHLHNDYEIHLDSASTIQQCYEDDPTIPRHQFHFRNVGDIENMESNSITDLIGIVSSISPSVSIMRKNQTEVLKRSLQLKDMSGRSVEFTMWGDFCNAEGQKLQMLCDSGASPVLAVKAGRISEFNGKQVSTIGSSQLFIEPDFPEARELREWYDREGRNAHFTSISREFTGAGRQEVRKVITQIKDDKLGTSEKPDWITVCATISFMKVENFCYTACPNMNGDRPCSKKVTNNGDGTWRCEKCDKSVEECDYRYILQIQLQDHTGLTWATAFQEAGEEIIGISAKDLYYIKYEHQEEEKFEDIIRSVTFSKYIFKLKIKEETYSDEQRVKATVVKAEKINYSSDTRFMLEAMDKLRTGDANSLPVKLESSNYRSDALNSGIGTSGTRDTASVDARREFGLPAANQVGQYGNQYAGPISGITSCNACGSNGHVSANCPSLMSEPQGQYTQGRYTGGGTPRQHVGGY